MDKRLNDCNHQHTFNSTCKICLKSPKSKVILATTMLLVFLIRYYDDLKRPLISSLNSSLLYSKRINKINFASDNAKEKSEIAWILSFPNSGTSFTTALVRNCAIANFY